MLPAFLSILFLLPSSTFAWEWVPPNNPACRGASDPSLCKISLPNTSSVADAISTTLSFSSTGNKNALLVISNILAKAKGNKKVTDATKKCTELLDYSSRRASAASSAVKSGGDIADVRAWASATLYYQYACWSSLKSINNTRNVPETRSYLKLQIEHTSNALSMIAALERYGNDTAIWGPPQTERDGYWGRYTSVTKDELGSKIGVPTNLVPNATVCKDKGCKYGTIQSAVNDAPNYRSRRFVIYIKKGVYDEIVRVPFEKTNMVFVGDGMGKTVITGNLNAGMPGMSTFYTATVGVAGDGFMARDLTISNTAGPKSYQAVALRSDSDKSIFEYVEFIGHQDTLFADALRQLYKSCIIYGTVDFIFGNSAAFFEDCKIMIVPRQLKPEKGEKNTITAHSRSDPAQSTGFVFYRCIVNATDDYYRYYSKKPEIHKNYLGRPWNVYSRTVFIDSYLGLIMSPEGWLPWSEDSSLSTLFYGEFGNSGPGANSSTRVKWSSQIPEEHLGAYSVKNFIQMK